MRRRYVTQMDVPINWGCSGAGTREVKGGERRHINIPTGRCFTGTTTQPTPSGYYRDKMRQITCYSKAYFDFSLKKALDKKYYLTLLNKQIHFNVK